MYSIKNEIDFLSKIYDDNFYVIKQTKIYKMLRSHLTNAKNQKNKYAEKVIKSFIVCSEEMTSRMKNEKQTKIFNIFRNQKNISIMEEVLQQVKNKKKFKINQMVKDLIQLNIENEIYNSVISDIMIFSYTHDIEINSCYWNKGNKKIPLR